MYDHGRLIESASITLAQGAIAGLAGGIAMALAMAVLSASVGESPWQLPNRLAGVVLGTRRTGTWYYTAVGLSIHIVLSVCFGALFALVVDRLTHEFWMTGLAYGLTLWVINYWLVELLPRGKELNELKTSWLSPLAHIVYGGIAATVGVLFAAAAMHGAT